MDVDVFLAQHQAQWARCEHLASRRHRLTGEEADELVALYQRCATHLSVVRSSAPDPALVARLSTLVARARAAVVGAPGGTLADARRFVTVSFPAALYRSRWWWSSTAGLFVMVSVAIAWWVASHPQVQASIAAPEEIRQLVDNDFEAYYSANPATSFAFRVWTNNAWVAAGSLALGVLLLPVVYILLTNAANVAVSAGLMAANGKLGLFFGLILPHGLLELTAVFVAAGAGLRLGWAVVAPGRRSRAVALAEEGRSAGGIAVGLVGVLLISGVIEAFVTPSGLPTGARISIGVVALAGFLAYALVLGSRAAAAGEIGDLDASVRGDLAPAAG